MGEFQYYEFYSIDKELTRKERKEVDGLSSRFSPTSRRAVFSYSYSSFRHKEETVLLKYFDYFFYISNWGTKRIMYKFPKDLVDYDEIKKYVHSYDTFVNNELSIYKKEDFVIINIEISEEEGGGWLDEDEGSYWSMELMGLRQDIMNGDYRSLFIVWLHLKSMEYEAEEMSLDEGIPKQLIPANLGQLNAGLNRLIELYKIDKDWVSGAAKYSKQSEAEKEDYSKAVTALPIEKKNEYLIRILDGEPNLNLKLKKEIENIGNGNKKRQEIGEISFSELLSLVHEAENKREILEKAEAEAERLSTLREIEMNKEIILKEINYHIKRGSGKSYDEALARILKLRDLAKHKGEELDFGKWINQLKKEVKNKPAMLRRMYNHDL